MEIRLFDKIISIKSAGCRYGSQPAVVIPPSVNLLSKLQMDVTLDVPFVPMQYAM